MTILSRHCKILRHSQKIAKSWQSIFITKFFVIANGFEKSVWQSINTNHKNGVVFVNLYLWIATRLLTKSA
ncbi:hypothetical protein [Helicobacter sp. T3_23-1056]